MKNPSNPTNMNSSDMYVIKRNGERERVDVNKIVDAISQCATGLTYVSPMKVATKTINGLYDGATTKELDDLSIYVAFNLTREEPEYSKLAARLLSRYIDEETRTLGVITFVDSIRLGHEVGIINDRLYEFVEANSDKLLLIVDGQRDQLFEYFGLKTVYDRYLLHHPTSREVIERPQHFFLRVACALSRTIDEVKPFYDLLSNLDYLPSSPTLFNAGTVHEQLSSCFLVDSPQDSLESIYKRYMQVAKLSKYSGGIGIAFSRVRSRDSLIKGTNGFSNGIVPWLKTLDSSVAAVNQGGRRKGAACVYLETWHADIEEFLELRDNSGDQARRTHNVNIANWIPDLFMKRVEENAEWSLFDPKEVPELCDLFGKDFDEAYLRAEREGLAVKTINASNLYKRMMRTLAQTGNGWMTFKDRCNLTCNQTSEHLITERDKAHRNSVVHLSNLCTEILEVSSDDQTAVCNLGSINLSHHVYKDENDVWHVDYEKLGRTTAIAIRHLDRVIDLNFYPIPEASSSNEKWRPVGLGMMGLQDVFFKIHEPFDSDKAREVSRRIAEEIYYHAIKTSVELAKEFGPYENFDRSRTARGEFQFDYWDTKPHSMARWDALREEVKTHGMRNSLLIAIAPTATIASIAGCYECIEPQLTNLFKRETLSGDFVQINRYLVQDLKNLGLWTEKMKESLLMADGSVQNIKDLSPEIRKIYRTAWEMKMKPLIEMAAERGAFIDQSQSLNLFSEKPDIGSLSAMYFYTWKAGMKTSYYLRSRPATSIAKTTVSTSTQLEFKSETEKAKQEQDEQAKTAAQKNSCSLENPEYCEACQ